MNNGMTLITIGRDGVPCGHGGRLPDIATQVCTATAKLYDSVGFDEPWVCYLAVSESVLVGTCGFKSPPIDGRAEIAYFTFPEFEGNGIATLMATKLITLAREHQPSIQITAQTLPDRNASHRILEKLGFHHTDTIEHIEDGTIWEWHLPETQET